jgi:hypothetical protein
VRIEENDGKKIKCTWDKEKVKVYCVKSAR